VWQRLGDLFTDIFSMGIYREPQHPEQVPFFLQETRRKIFAAAYKSDKTLATYLGRSPRIPKQYTYVRPPLDISDQTLVAKGLALDRVLSSLDANEWNTEGSMWPAGFICLRNTTCTLREEILELSLGNDRHDMVRSLK